MADEIELKLDLSLDDAGTVEASGLLPGDPVIVLQRSIYFDTPDHDLAQAGMSLRIRRTGSKRIQTVKAGGASAGLYVRPEWERSVRNDTPILDDTTPIRAILGEKADVVAPLFEVRVERRVWIIEEGRARIEVAFDRGEVIAGGRTAPICEIELELKEGGPDALFAFARRIDALVPLRLGVRTKAERGYALTGPSLAMAKAEPVTLNGEIAAASALQAIVHNCLRQFRLNEALLPGGRQAEALHQARVALRRLRAALSIFRPVIGDAATTLGRELRWLAGELGKARNLDVLLEHASSGPLLDRIAAAREAAYDDVMAVLASSRTRSLMLDVAQWLSSEAHRGASEAEAERSRPAREFAIAALDRLRRKVKKGGRDLAAGDDASRHELRKDAKKLRYGAEFFAGLFTQKRERRRIKRFQGLLEQLQDELGALNDLATMPTLLAQLGIDDDPDASALLSGRKKGKLIEAAIEAYADLIDAKRFWR